MLPRMTTTPSASLADYRPRWSLGTALAYAGALAVVVADNWGLYHVGHEHKVAGAFLALGFAVGFTVVASVFKRRADGLTAGLAALLAATAVPWIVAALAEADQGIGPNESPVSTTLGTLLTHQPHGTEAAWIGVDAIALLAAVLYLLRFKLPLLMVPAVFAIWFGGQEIAAATVTSREERANFLAGDLGKSAAAGLIVALVLLLLGILLDRWGRPREALWPHIGAALATVQSMFTLAIRYDNDAVAGAGLALSVVGIALALGLRRSVYGVVGGLAFILTGAYFLEKSVSIDSLGFAFVVATLAAVVAALGIVLERQARAT